MDIAPVAGLWLDASAWDVIVPELRQLGHHPVAISLPGHGVAPPEATLADQRNAVVAAVDAAAYFAGWEAFDGPDAADLDTEARRASETRAASVPGAVAGGQLPEVARATRVDYVDIDSEHWPMFTRPAELSRPLAEIADA